MTTTLSVIVQLPSPAADDTASDVIDAARAVLALAASRGADAVILPELDGALVDPTVLAGLLSADGHDVAILVEARTDRHAPFNLARRAQTIARLTGGRAGLYLRGTGVDPITAAGRPGTDRGSDVTAEYAEVLRRLWDSFPLSALLGDREAGLFADIEQIEPARHQGEVFGVEGALNIPIAGEHRPLLLADADAIGAGAAIDALVGDADQADAPVYRPITWAAVGLIADETSGGRVLLRFDVRLADAAAHVAAALDALGVTAARPAAPALRRRSLAAAVA
ncbi:LLM class flavin-dependent oxidoreductase [Microbacterium sp. ZW T5_45]|uniref:LLM class flavin-dependent oxidoreductase n=1 Tax=Microbacterium sp. ZW T5_45 TaxID=3378080 RepID=UPI003854D4EC